MDRSRHTKRVPRKSKMMEQRRRALLVRRGLYGGVASVLVAAITIAGFSYVPPGPAAFPNGITSYSSMHIHPHLAIFRGPNNITVPLGIGINATRWKSHALDNWSLNGPSFSPLHTDDTNGTIHVESKVTRPYTLGEFFAVWGQPLGPDRVLGFPSDGEHKWSMLVDGQASTAWGDLVFKDGQQIQLHYDNVTA